MTLPWWLITLGGLLGSSHCVGMCGGFAVMLGLHRKTLGENLRAQLVFSLGRLASYAALGGAAGFAGRTLVQRMPALVNVPAVLSLAAGLFLLWEGLQATGLLRRRPSALGPACLFSPLFATLIKVPALRSTFSAGVFTGLLPCGLVYAFVSLAASSGDLGQGALTMLAFGIGTVPLMVLTGTGAMLLGATARQRLWRVAAWSVVVTGVLTVGRGVTFLQAAERPPAERCPLCRSAALTGEDLPRETFHP
uniref:Sulfite exporter TauE/SafE family protein n=1 Tax=Schlesneria paludicola TaxID=360056 RepID=A0A7C2K149_9PLAN